MKRFISLLAIFLFAVVGMVWAQDDDTEAMMESSLVTVQNFEAGSFYAEEEGYTLELVVSGDVDYIQTSPFLDVGTYPTAIFFAGFAAIEDLETIEAVLVLEEQKVVLILSNPEFEDEFVVFHAEVIEIVPFDADNKGAEELFEDFEDAMLVLNFGEDYGSSLTEAMAGLGLRTTNSPN